MHMVWELYGEYFIKTPTGLMWCCNHNVTLWRPTYGLCLERVSWANLITLWLTLWLSWVWLRKFIAFIGSWWMPYKTPQDNWHVLIALRFTDPEWPFYPVLSDQHAWRHAGHSWSASESPRDQTSPTQTDQYTCDWLLIYPSWSLVGCRPSSLKESNWYCKCRPYVIYGFGRYTHVDILSFPAIMSI